MRWLNVLWIVLGGCSDPGPCRSAAVTKGPWVMRADGQGASVFWETKEQGCVAIGLTPEAGGEETIVTGSNTITTVTSSFGADIGLKMPDLAGTYYIARVDATGLAPGACYSYRMRATDGVEAKARFCTARSPGQPFKFFAIGDTNPILGHTTGTLAATMPEKPDFTVHTGDIQYYSSVGETWAYWFGAMAPMLRAGAFFPAVGNHENELNGAEYTDYFDRLFHRPSLDGTPKWYRFSSGGVWFHTIDSEEPYDSGSPQYQWLSNSLGEVSARPDYKFAVIYMHRNLYTLGDAAPQTAERMHLTPLFVANKVRLVLSGHMHGYERFEVGDITYVTTAGGGGIINDIDKNVTLYPQDAPLRVAKSNKYHGVLFDVAPLGNGSKLRGRAIDETGAVIDEFSHDIP